MAPAYFIQRWNVRSLPETLANDDLLGGSKGYSRWLLKTLQNLREPTKLVIEFCKIHQRNAGGNEAVLIGKIFEALKVNQHVTELTLMNMPQMHLIDQVLEANDTITKVSLLMGGDFFYNGDINNQSMGGYLLMGLGCNKSDSLNFDVLRRLLTRGPQIELSLEGRLIGDLCGPLASAIRNSSTLTSLRLAHCRYFGMWLQSITDVVPSCSALSKLEISNTGLEEYGDADAIGDILKGNSALTELILSDNCLGEWLKPICGALLTNSTLKKLDLADNNITDTSACHLAKVLRDCSTLTELCLHGNYISKPDIVRALQHNTTLMKLQFEGNHPGLETTLTDVIRNNRTLCALDLSRTEMTFGLIEALGEALKHNQSLVELKLCARDKINPDSQPYHVFGEGLKANSTLKSLWMEEDVMNQAREELTIAAAKALAVNTGLTKLALVVWHMKEECFSQLADGLERNTTLTELQLGDVKLDDKTAPILVRGLKSNTSLKCLDLHSIYCSGVTHLAEVLSSSTSLEVLKIKDGHDEKPMIVALASFLEESKSLKRLQIPYDLEKNKLVKEALMKAYKENANLKCTIYGFGDETDEGTVPDADWSESCFWYYHRLNRTGRGLWSSSTFPAALWPAALTLADARSSPECPDLLFHFIVEKPDIVKRREE